MKKSQACFVLLSMFCFLMLCACTASQSEAPSAEVSQGPTWQEQYDLGVRYLSEGNYEEAILAFTAAIEIDPKQAPAYVGRGDAYVGLGETAENLAEAKADYETAIELDEASPEAYLGLSGVYVRQGDYEKALETLQQGFDIIGDSSLKERISDIQSEIGMTQDNGKSFEQLLKSGETDNMLLFEEITFLGEPLQKLSVDEISSKMIAAGMDVDVREDEDTRCISAYVNRTDYNNHISALQFNNEPYVCLISYTSYRPGHGVSIGIRDLMTNDSIGELFTALGFSNGSEIDSYFCELMYADYNSFDEVQQVAQALHYSNHALSIEVTGISASERENGSYAPSRVEFFLSLYGNNGYGFSFASPISADNFGDRLSDFSIHIYRQ